MTKTTKQAAIIELDSGTAPTVIASNAHAIDVVSPDRRRPVLAINDNGELTVCCRRTARKHGWKLEGALFQRTRSGKRAAAAAAGKDKKLAVDLDTGNLTTQPALKSVAQHRRVADNVNVQRAGAVHIADAVHQQLMDSLLAAGKNQ